MNTELLLALAGFAFVTSATPGPNNMMLMASGANFGIRRTVPHMLGVAWGFALMIVLVGLGIDRLIASNPALETALKWISLAYMLWLAWKIANAAPPQQAPSSPQARPFTFLQAAAFQWVNPKAWAMALGALSAYAAGVGGALVVGAVFAVVNLSSVSIWAMSGQGLRRLLTTPARLRLFNITMAILLVASMLPVLWK
ncbi:LysE family translocator [Paracoccus saliphilus]|uniref:LysE family translocator n=1 Tax=Paracoccus saliphilus TaxID=405559 RepID=A0AA45W4R0_9RHOB|nr:LysE family translocator [Paracoccus saliphilus]WCR04607.1 LysE family translocator [Paracoccus saliphilus]SIS87405.1 Threonine/homoserine/homoserine lactone efflux protein [Paracoccus saliphilus]